MQKSPDVGESYLDGIATFTALTAALALQRENA